jgi:hypothetical protein
MHISMAYMMNNSNQYQLKCLIGVGITLSQQNNCFKQWFTIKAYSIIPISNKVNKLHNHLNSNLKMVKMWKMEKMGIHLDRSIGSINEEDDLG